MRGENARLGVETTTRRDRTARSAIKSRSTLSIDQWRTARPERNWLEKIQLGGPRMGSSSPSNVNRFPIQYCSTQRLLNHRSLTCKAGLSHLRGRPVVVPPVIVPVQRSVT